VVPNQLNDMHDGKPQDAINRGDRWLRRNLGPVIKWAERNNTLIILTWDEDDHSADNHIVTMFIGQMVRPGLYGTRINHYSVLRTISDMYGLRPPGKSAAAAPITGIWKVN
jgi:acid phosphatase